MPDEQRDIVRELLDHLGLDPAQVPAATLAAVRATLQDDELDPRALAARVSRLGGQARSGHNGSRGRSARPQPTAEQLDGLNPRQLVDLLHPEEDWR